LPARALPHGLFDLVLDLRCHLVLQHVQVVLLVEVEHLGEDAHADTVRLAQPEVHDNFLRHR